METRILAEVIGDMRTDRAFSLALEADPWLALACQDLIGRPTPTPRVELGRHGPVPVGRGQWRHRPSGHRRAA